MTMEMMDDLDLGRSLKSYSNMFSNAADFNFVFVGNFDEAVMLPLIEKYIASLPSSNTKTNWADMGIRPPTGPGTKIIKKGIEPKSAVQIIYTGMSESTSQERIQLQALTKLMQIKLRESLREDASGTYGVGCYGGINRIPTQDFSVTISFQCDPANVEMLVAAANEVIRNVQQNGCSDEDLTKVIEGLRRARETQLQENNYWASTLSNAALYGEEVLNDKMVEDIFSSIHSESLKASAVKYFDPHHRREFVLMPE